MSVRYRRADVRIVEQPEIRVAVLEHRGDPDTLDDSIRRFIDWRRAHRLPPAVSATYNILYRVPEGGTAADFRLDLCAAVSAPVAANPHGVVERRIPGGRCAVLRHVGSDDTLGEAIRFLHAEWLPGSGETARDFPVWLQRLRFHPEVAECEAESDLFLPLCPVR